MAMARGRRENPRVRIKTIIIAILNDFFGFAISPASCPPFVYPPQLLHKILIKILILKLINNIFFNIYIL